MKRVNKDMLSKKTVIDIERCRQADRHIDKNTNSQTEKQTIKHNRRHMGILQIKQIAGKKEEGQETGRKSSLTYEDDIKNGKCEVKK